MLDCAIKHVKFKIEQLLRANPAAGTTMRGMAKRKNAAAVALAKRRAAKLSPERRSDIGKMGASARIEGTTPEQRSNIARKAAAARWRKKD
jgi:hypothetical protein